MSKIVGDNAHGFANEHNFVEELNKGIKNINLNLKEFIKYICINEGIEYSDTMDLSASLESNDNLKQDFYLTINNNKFGISLKLGSGNSVHQEKIEDFINFIKKDYNANDEICDLWRFFIWADGTLDGSGSLEKNKDGKIKSRFNATEFKNRYPDKRKKLQNFIAINEKDLIEHFLFVGRHNSKVDYFYHGTPTYGTWISANKILEYQLKNSKKHSNRGCLYCGKMTVQVWNRSINGKNEHKRGELQIKYGTMKQDLVELMFLERKKNEVEVGTFEGDSQEYNLTQLLNKNKNHKYWKTLVGSIENDNLYIVTVNKKPLSRLSNKRVFSKSDAYVIKSNNISDKFLLERENLIKESDLKNIKYEIVPSTGISIKLKESKNFTIQKFTKDSFIKAFDNSTFNVKELLYGLLVYSNPKDLEKNKVIAKDLDIDYEDFIESKKSMLNISDFGDEKYLFDKIRLEAQEELHKIIIENKELQEAIFMGKHWFDDPYYAEYIYVYGNLEKNKPGNEFSITTGSGRSKGKYNISIKPKNNK